MWTYRAHLIAQYPGYRLVPFVVLGLGGMTVKSHPDTLGNDGDPEMHWGLGAKWAFNEYVSARFDFRDNLMQKNLLLSGVEDGDLVHNTRILAGPELHAGPHALPAHPSATGRLRRGRLLRSAGRLSDAARRGAEWLSAP